MLHLALSVGLLLGAPAPASRLQLADLELAPAAPVQLRSSPPPEPGLRLSEVLAGSGGALVGHAAAVGLAFAADALFSGCDGDVCHVSPMVYVALVAGELILVPLLSATAALLASLGDHPGSFLEAWGRATVGHLLGMVLVVPVLAVGPVVDTRVVFTLLATGLAFDCGMTGLAADVGLRGNDRRPPPPVVLPPPPPTGPDQLPPPVAARVQVTVARF